MKDTQPRWWSCLLLFKKQRMRETQRDGHECKVTQRARVVCTKGRGDSYIYTKKGLRQMLKRMIKTLSKKRRR